MRDCVFLVADKNMEATFSGFFSRQKFHLSIGTRAFAFDAAQDLIVDESGHDPGIYRCGHELLRPYLKSHRHAVVVLDEAWDGTPGAERIRQEIDANMLRAGWRPGSFAAIVIRPELENWIWQDSPHLAAAFRFTKQGSRPKNL